VFSKTRLATFQWKHQALGVWWCLQMARSTQGLQSVEIQTDDIYGGRRVYLNEYAILF
jgi:hypothetical protein